MNYNELDTSILEAFKELDTSSLTDALDKQGLPEDCWALKPLFREPVLRSGFYGAIYSLRSDQGQCR